MKNGYDFTPTHMRNPKNRNQVSGRFNATWGEIRPGDEGYYKYYAMSVDQVEPQPELGFVHLNNREKLIDNAYRWATATFTGVSYEDIRQEINIKAFILEEAGEFDYQKVAKAIILLYLTHPYTLRIALQDEAKEYLDLMSDREKGAAQQFLVDDSPSVVKAYDDAVRRVFKIKYPKKSV